MKHLCTILATALAAALSASAKTFDWPIDATAAGARQFTAYHGETVRFNLKFGGAMTNLSPVCIYYQTNGMGKAEWFEPIPGTVFHPTNDCGAAFYRFFVRCTDPDGVNYSANGSLRMLDSPGFVPNELPFPARTLDFSRVKVLNPPWATADGIAAATNALTRALEEGEILTYAADAVIAESAMALGENVEGIGIRTATVIFSQLDAATRTNAMQDARLIDATNEILRAAAEHTDSAIQSATSGLTELGDDRVYEAAGLGDFTWSSDRADILAALGSQQPHVGYESGGWAEYSLDFSVGETNYYGYAYVETSARTVSFDVYGWYYNWDDETGQEVYGEDAATVVGTRSPSSAVPTGDRYARQADMTSVQSEMSSLRALYNGETKVMRDGGEGQHGYGWGYLQHPLSGEARYWRIRVPKWTAFPGAATNNLSATNVYATMHAGPGRYPLPALGAGRPIPLNPASWCPTWGVRRTLVATRGVNGSDAVAMADWDVGFSFLATNGTDRCAMNFHVTQTSSSPMSYSVTPDVTYMTPILIPTGADQSELAVSNVWYVRYVDLAPQSRSWVADGAEVETTVTVKGFLADPDQVETSANGVIPMTYWTVMDAVYRWRARRGYSIGAWSSYVTARDMLTRFTAKATCASLSILENAKVPYYRLVTTLDGHLYYDAALDETYRIVSSNGVFFSEWHCDGDWRKREAP